jgi:hypothetical protein
MISPEYDVRRPNCILVLADDFTEYDVGEEADVVSSRCFRPALCCGSWPTAVGSFQFRPTWKAGMRHVRRGGSGWSVGGGVYGCFWLFPPHLHPLLVNGSRRVSLLASFYALRSHGIIQNRHEEDMGHAHILHEPFRPSGDV